MQTTIATFKPECGSGFIVLDGVNGAGKSTQLQNLLTFLTDKGIPCTTTREPGGTEFGTHIRSIILGSKPYPIHPLAESFLFAADRAQHVAEVIQPAIQSKTAIISDRYYYSTLAFQGYGRGLDLNELEIINQIAIAGTVPDLVFLFDLDPVIGLQRTRSRASAEHDSFEQEEIAFHMQLREGFLELSNRLPEPFVILDAAQSADAVWQQMLPFVTTWLDACELERSAE